MAAMANQSSAYDLRSAAGWFRLIALAEAASWVGLLIGMYFKYLGSPQTEIGVKLFGPVHGGVFVAFLVAAAVVGISHRWTAVTWLLALLGSIVPLGSVIFLIWADRSGRMGGRWAVTQTMPGVGQPGREVTETT